MNNPPVAEQATTTPRYSQNRLVSQVQMDVINRTDVQQFMASNPGYQEALQQQLSGWGKQLEINLKYLPQDDKQQQELALFQTMRKQSAERFRENLDAFFLQLRSLSEFYPQARALINDHPDWNAETLQSELLSQWQQHLDMQLLELQLALIEQEREQLLADIAQRMETAPQLEEIILEAEPNHYGRLWDLSTTRLNRKQLHNLHSFSKALDRNQAVKALADQLGRMDAYSPAEHQANTPNQVVHYRRKTSPQLQEEIHAIHLKGEINHMLPSEALYLAYPELEILFYKHLIEQRLLSYQYRGSIKQPSKTERPQSRKKTPRQEPGPFIVCVDSSGSMTGYPETCAKALCLGLMQYALKQNRDCYAITFSTDISCFELTEKHGLEELLDFLSYSFNGGTDMQPSIRHGIELMAEGRYARADLLIISDFVAQSLPQALVSQVEALKRQQNRFHAVSLSKYGNPELMPIFDHIWPLHNKRAMLNSLPDTTPQTDDSESIEQ